MALPEPWLRGPLAGVSPYVAPLLRSFEQAREDLAHWTAALDPDRIWAQPHGLPSVGFQLRHIAGSVDRLSTYLAGRQLNDEQLLALKSEAQAGATREVLLAAVDEAFRRAAEIACAIPAAELDQPRSIGRKALPTTAIGLIVHLAEHTQRHVGQVVTTSKYLGNQS
jgi:uncharacterized damage-inducible protein DinB